MCGRLLEAAGERLVCGACLRRLEPERRPFCPRCGLFFQPAGPPDLCSSCVQNPPPFLRHRSAGLYAGLLKELILFFKYRDGEALGRELARFGWETLREDGELWKGVEGFVPVPLHGRRRRARGFNQAEVLARFMARQTALPLLGRHLVRTKDVPPQAGLNSGLRRRNVRGAFAVHKPADIFGRRLMVIDDVYTTGSTVGECCRVLRRAGAGDVRVLTLARVQM